MDKESKILSSLEKRTENYFDALHKLASLKVDTTKSIKMYTRSAGVLYRQAMVYLRENDIEKAFILLLKFSNLIVRELPKHPEYKGAKGEVAALRDNLLKSMDILEKSKPILLETFKKNEQAKERQTQRRAEEKQRKLREVQAKVLIEQANKDQAEARKKRIAEMQKYDQTLREQKTTEKLIDHESVNDSKDEDAFDDETSPLTSPSISSTSPTKTSQLQPSKALHYLESGMPLRSIHTPSSLIPKFTNLANQNTLRNLETCGVLAGALANDQFTITTLIIPKQTSTSDSVTMINEEEMFAVQDELDIITLGWIHTHPTQQCFMSSVDLHTQFPYQLLIAEAIAIVVAPTQTPNFGIFRLTDPPGLGIIGDCDRRGFHAHNTDGQIYREIYHSADRGHVDLRENIDLRIVDLREK